MTDARAPWLAAPPAPDLHQGVAVVGAGVAGAALARELAEQGVAVRVLEADAPAAGASGNPAAVLRPLLARRHDDPLARFISAAFRATRERVEQLRAAGHPIDAAFDGALHCHPDPGALVGEDEHTVWDLAAAQRALGEGARLGGLWLPRAGWVCPRDYTLALLDHPRIAVQRGELTRLHHDGLGWRLYGADEQHLLDAGTVVLAGGWRLPQLLPDPALGLRPVASLLLHAADPAPGDGPRAPLVGAATVCPAGRGHIVAGGHWSPDDPSGVAARREELLQAAATQWRSPAGLAAQPRQATRATSRDYLPSVGGVPDFDAAAELYADLHHGRPSHHYPAPPYRDGLYLIGGLGGRGITSAQLCARTLRHTLLGEPAPWAHALHPLRFLIRDLKRGKRASTAPPP